MGAQVRLARLLVAPALEVPPVHPTLDGAEAAGVERADHAHDLVSQVKGAAHAVEERDLHHHDALRGRGLAVLLGIGAGGVLLRAELGDAGAQELVDERQLDFLQRDGALHAREGARREQAASPNSRRMSGRMLDPGASASRESSSRSMSVAPHSRMVRAMVDLPEAMPPAR